MIIILQANTLCKGTEEEDGTQYRTVTKYETNTAGQKRWELYRLDVYNSTPIR